MRRALGLEGAGDRLAAIEAALGAIQVRLDQLERSRWPHGPVYLGQGQALVATRWGAKMVVDTRDHLLAPWLLMDGLWESHATGWLQGVLRPGQTVVDVGANIGYFTLLAAQSVGSEGRVVAVEAHPETYELLRRNVVMNGYHSFVRTWNRAAWSEPGTVQFHKRIRYAANSSVASVGGAGLSELGDAEEAVEVESAPLDDLLAGVGPVDILKVDVEGAELQVFRGLAGTVQASPAVRIMLEWSPEQLVQMGTDPGELVDLIAGWGFGFRLLEDDLAPVMPESLSDLAYGNLIAER